jgi:hypothetical protein
MAENPVNELTESGKRVAEAVNLHLRVNQFDAIGKWVACALSAGRSDMVLYDTKADAIRHQLHEQYACYVCIPPNGMSDQDGATYLRIMRQMRDAGVRIADPDKHVVMKS